MSNVEDRLHARDEQVEFDRKYAEAVASIRKNQEIEAGQAGALMFAAVAYGEELEGNKAFQMASHLAKLFCIAAVLIIPNLLIIDVLL